MYLQAIAYRYMSFLTHLPRVPHICVSELGRHWFRYWLVACLAQSHYLNKCFLIVNWTLRNKLQWNLNQNTKPFVYENAFQNVVCEMTAILSRRKWVKVLLRVLLRMCCLWRSLNKMFCRVERGLWAQCTTTTTTTTKQCTLGETMFYLLQI